MGISYYRNPIIAQMLCDYGMAEKAGRGIAKILKYCKENNRVLPVFESDNYSFNVTVFNANKNISD